MGQEDGGGKKYFKWEGNLYSLKKSTKDGDLYHGKHALKQLMQIMGTL